MGGKVNGFVREDGFTITVASEIMAILCLSKDLEDLKDRIARSKYIAEKDLDAIDKIFEDLKVAIDDLISKGGVANA